MQQFAAWFPAVFLSVDARGGYAMKRRITSILLAILMVFAMIPLTTGKVYAAADTTPPVVDLSSLRVEYPEGKDSVTAGDTVTLKLSASDEEGGSGIDSIYYGYYSPITQKDRQNTVYATEEFDGTFSMPITVDSDFESGTWVLKFMRIYDKKGNSTEYFSKDVYIGDPNGVDLSNGNFVVMDPPQLPTDLSTTGDNDSGYKLAFNGTIGDKDYYLNDKESITPSVEVFYQDETGARDLLQTSKYDILIQRRKADGTYEDAEFPLTYGENRTATYKISAVAREGSGYSGETQAFTVNVIKNCKVTFNTRGGNSIAPQYIIPGEKVLKPDDPTKEGMLFGHWFADEELTQEYNFYAPVEEDITIYADWYAVMAIGILNDSNPENMECGTVDIETANVNMCQQDVTVMNFMAPEGSVKFTAKPAKGYRFTGFYKGEIGRSGFVEGPTDELLSENSEYICDATELIVCAVFECAEHQWEEKIQKASLDADGRIYMVCPVCGVEETIAPIPKVSKISLERTSFAFTGKAITPKVTVTNTEEALSDDCYDVIYSNNTNVGTATAKVTFKGDYYEGSKTLTFKITAKKITPSLTLSTATYTYNGIVRTPGISVKDGSVALKKDKDYTVTYSTGRKNAGSYKVTVKLKGNYSGTASKTFKINKAANPLKIKAKTATVKLSILKSKKKQTLAVTKVISFTKKGQGKMAYKKASGSKYITINKSNGKVTVKKGITKGTYKVKVNVRAAGNTNYKTVSKTVSVKVTVK